METYYTIKSHAANQNFISRHSLEQMWSNANATDMYATTDIIFKHLFLVGLMDYRNTTFTSIPQYGKAKHRHTDIAPHISITLISNNLTRRRRSNNQKHTTMSTTITQSRQVYILSHTGILNEINARNEQKNATRKNTEKKNPLDTKEEETLLVLVAQRYTTQKIIIHLTKTETHPITNTNNALSGKMKMRVLSYVFSILDHIFEYFNLYQILASKLTDLDATIANFAILIGAVLSILTYYCERAIKRIRETSSDNNTPNFNKVLEKIAIVGSVFTRPMLYNIIRKIIFHNGNQWTYFITFLFILWLIITRFIHQIKALKYFHHKQNEDTKTIKMGDKIAIIDTEHTSFIDTFEN